MCKFFGRFLDDDEEDGLIKDSDGDGIPDIADPNPYDPNQD